jgi:Gluconate 2-dehydrogenase subunit 3
MMMEDFMTMTRRAMMARVALLLGAAAVPAEAFAAAPAKGAKHFLAPAQFALMSAVSDTIVPVTDTPGALAAGVPAKLDGMLGNWASAETKKLVVDALGRIDAASKAAGKGNFAALSAADRDAVLRPHDAAALKSVPPPPGAKAANPFAPVNYVVDNGYLKLKELVIGLYYASEIGMTQELVYEHVPGEWQPSVKIDANTRPWANVGPF